jgi:hypothetical protein
MTTEEKKSPEGDKPAEKPTSAGQDTMVTFAVPLGAANFIMATLNKNPLGNDVMNVASLISSIKGQVQAQLDAAKAYSLDRPRPVKRRR